jgi:opacity protein-like surface antigen
MRVTIAAAVVVFSLMSAGVLAQLVQPVPGPGSGIVTVSGNVSVANTPSVKAAQSGDWKVTLANTPIVQLTPPEFLRLGGRYEVVSTSGQRETIVVLQIGSGGWGAWVKAQTHEGRARWVNVAAAASVEEVR